MRKRDVLILTIVSFVISILTSSSYGRERANDESTTVKSRAVEPRIAPPAPASVVPQHVEDEPERAIRAEIERSFANDPALKNREITFTIEGGDVKVTGTVKTAKEREKVNELAMAVEGVKSISNALRVSEM